MIEGYSNKVNKFIRFAYVGNNNDFIKYLCVRCYVNRMKGNDVKDHLLFMTLTKGIHNGYGMMKPNYLLCLAIIKTRVSGTQRIWV